MSNQKILQQGAEAIIYLQNNEIIKDRIKKSYRIKEIDEKLRKARTKSEAKILNKLSETISVPKLISTDEKQKIIMEYINGEKLSSSLETLDYKKICKILGEEIAKMHNKGIIHGDLTTSNLIYVEDNRNDFIISPSLSNDNLNINNINNKITVEKASKRSLQNRENKSSASEASANTPKVYFIDFGLAFHSLKIEDKAVDLHLLQQAMEAKHFTIWKECLEIILKNYEKKANQGKEILQRIKVIESRGRYKDKY